MAGWCGVWSDVHGGMKGWEEGFQEQIGDSTFGCHALTLTLQSREYMINVRLQQKDKRRNTKRPTFLQDERTHHNSANPTQSPKKQEANGEHNLMTARLLNV